MGVVERMSWLAWRASERETHLEEAPGPREHALCGEKHEHVAGMNAMLKEGAQVDQILAVEERGLASHRVHHVCHVPRVGSGLHLRRAGKGREGAAEKQLVVAGVARPP